MLSSLTLDYRGAGRSEGPRGDWTLDLLVADARAAIDWGVAEAARPVVLFGDSLGAMVALATGVVDARVAAVVASNCPARVGDLLMTPLQRALFAAAKAIAPVCPLRVSVNRFYAYTDLIDDHELIEHIARDVMSSRPPATRGADRPAAHGRERAQSPVRIDTGHLPNPERPARIARTVFDWLATTRSTP